MCLIITLLAAIISTVIWYFNPKSGAYRLSVPCFIYWGASLMWLADAVFEYAKLGADYFRPAPADMINDAYLGICCVTAGLLVWLVVLLIKDPKGVLKDILTKKH